MPNLYIDRNAPSFSHELWNAIGSAKTIANVYKDPDMVYGFTTTENKKYPERTVKLDVKNLLDYLNLDHWNKHYSTEDKVDTLNVLKKIQTGLPLQYEGIAGQIYSFIFSLLHYWHTNVWISKEKWDNLLIKSAIGKITKEIDSDVKTAYELLNKAHDNLRAAAAAKNARQLFQKKRAAAITIQKSVRGHQVRKVARALKASLAKPQPSAPPAALEAPKPVNILEPYVRVEKPLPKLIFEDKEVEIEPRQFYLFDKNNPREVAERYLRIDGETVGTAGRTVRQLLRSLTKNVSIESLKSEPYRVYCLTLKQELIGTIPGRSEKITLPRQVFFEIKGEGDQRVIQFKNANLSEIQIDGDRVKVQVSWFNKVDKSYEEVCAFLESIHWTPVEKI